MTMTETAPKKKTSKNIIKVHLLDGSEHKIDLTQPCDKKFVDQYRSFDFIPVSLTREIMRVRKIQQVSVEDSFHAIKGKNGEHVICTCTVTISVDKRTQTGCASNLVTGNSMRVAGLGQTGKLRAIALKDALKKEFRFFEVDMSGTELTTSEDKEAEAEPQVEEKKEEKPKEEPKKSEDKKVVPKVADITGKPASEVSEEEFYMLLSEHGPFSDTTEIAPAARSIKEHFDIKNNTAEYNRLKSALIKHKEEVLKSTKK